MIWVKKKYSFTVSPIYGVVCTFSCQIFAPSQSTFLRYQSVHCPHSSYILHMCCVLFLFFFCFFIIIFSSFLYASLSPSLLLPIPHLLFLYLLHHLFLLFFLLIFALLQQTSKIKTMLITVPIFPYNCPTLCQLNYLLSFQFSIQ